MKKLKAMTLVEIIVAIALLGVISTGFLGVFGSNLNFINISKQNTQDIYATQRLMELAIESAKNDATMTYEKTLTDVFEPGLNVKVHQMSHSNGNDTLYTLISNTRLPELKVPVVETVTASLRKNLVPVIEAYAIGSTSVQGNFVMDSTTMDVFMVNTYQWYVSRGGFNIPAPVNYPEIEAGTKYPMFPDDYTVIPGATSTTLNDVTGYAGRHIVFTVSPAANSGKIGVTVPSNPVFISGLPVVSDDLVLHLDGSQIDENDTLQVIGSNVLKWNDLSNFNKPAIQSNDANRPMLMDQGITGDFVGKQVTFDVGKSMTVSHSELNGQNLHIFSVVKGDSSSVYMNNGFKNILTVGDPIGNDWLLSYETYTANSNIVTLGNSNVEIAELLVYRGTLTNDEIISIKKYLEEKYVPIDTIGEIVKLYDFSDEVIKNTSYIAPSAVKADMVFGNDRYVPVTWIGGASIDTTSAGVFNIKGKAVSDTTKEVTLTLTVKEPILVESVSVTPTTGSLYIGNMMTIIATVMPENAADKSVVWSSNNPSVATVDTSGTVRAVSAGSATITATTVEGGKSASAVVTVLSVNTMPSGMVLNLDANVGVYFTSGWVSSWKDQSGESNDFFQDVHKNRPGYSSTAINNLPGLTFNPNYLEFLRFDESSLSNVKMFTASPTEFTLFVVGSADTRSGNNRSTLFSQYVSNGEGSSYTLSRLSDGKFALSTSQNIKINTNGDGNPNIHTSIYNGSRLFYRLNRNNVNDTGNIDISNQNGSSFFVGLGPSSNSSLHALNGKIGEIMVFNRALNTSEISYVENYLYDKWFKSRAISYEFDSSSDRLLTKNDINSASNMNWISPGQIGGDITGNDPYFYLPIVESSRNISLSSNKTIKIRLKNSTLASYAQFYFTTYELGEGNMDETKVITFPIIPNSGFIEYTVDMSSLSKWTGRLKQLRFDPAVYANGFSGSYGNFEVDYIRIIE